MIRALAAAALGVVLVACSSGGSSSPPTTAPVLRSDLVPAAVAAVEAQRGGPQQYTEINAFNQGVNVFVATSEGSELAYVYTNGASAAARWPRSGQRDAVQHVGGVARRRPAAADRRQEAAARGHAGLDRPGAAARRRPRWDVGVLGSKGARIDMLYTPTGVFLGPVADQ